MDTLDMIWRNQKKIYETLFTLTCHLVPNCVTGLVDEQFSVAIKCYSLQSETCVSVA